MTKDVVRKELLAQRISLNKWERETKLKEAIYHITDINWNQVNIVMSYFPMEKFGEPPISILEEMIMAENPSIQFCYPKVDNKNMEAILRDNTIQLYENSFGTVEILEGTIIPPQSIDVAIVPMIIADKQGYRVGFGKGYYDKFLSQCDKHTIKLGVSLLPPIDNIDDVAIYDIPLDYLVFPEGKIIFNYNFK